MPESKNKPTADVGLIGLAVMGQNLALNMADHGFAVAVHNRTTATMDRFVADNPGTPGGLVPCKTIKKFVAAIKRPRKIILLVKAGPAIDAIVGQLLPHLSRGDVVIDGGNSLWTDTIRRVKEYEAKGIHFVGSGVSGGEEGARFGPSLMPGGSKEAWKQLKPIWNAIAAKVDRKTGKPLEGATPGKPVKGGVPCTAYIGGDGAGHYVKMVHNGIEYADMQVICEAYMIMREVLGMTPPEMSKVFARWNGGHLDSFLIEITADILQQKDPSSSRYFVDSVLDAAGQKGTGQWTSVNALQMGVPAASIAEAVFARAISAVKEERVAASRSLKGPKFRLPRTQKTSLVTAIRDALYCSKICSYAQGFALMAEAQKQYGWKLDFGKIAMIWRGGCIIRAGFLQKIADAYGRKKSLANLMLDLYFKAQMQRGQANWRKVIAVAAQAGVPCPVFTSSLAYYDSYRTKTLSANLLQAQRDYFGSHTYERVDRKRGKRYHLDWLDPNRPELPV